MAHHASCVPENAEFWHTDQYVRLNMPPCGMLAGLCAASTGKQHAAPAVRHEEAQICKHTDGGVGRVGY